MTREDTAQALVGFDRPLASLRDAVAGLPFDWDGPPLATLRCEDVLSVLARWQRGELAPEAVEEWANLVELRDDLALEPVVADAIFDLANPALQGPLAETGPRLIGQLTL